MTGLSAGFASPVRDAQAAFRCLLEAMARPGSIVVPRAPAAPPAPLPPAMAAVALTLLDADTPLWLDDGAEAVRSWLRFHCGCRLVADPGEASFLFVTDGARMPAHAGLRAGSDEYPDGSATVVVAVEALGRGEALALTGPGIDGTTELRVAGLPDRFVTERAGNLALFPRGIDAMLVAGGRLAALPRSTALTRQER
jgi:alpha-D-ribose 1-methylphosphonate 5-triphosphate synthase subunit PhnH